MGDTYTRQSSYTDGDVITAAHTNNEFNQLLAAFAASTGHTHDGTAAEGGPITKLLGNTLTFGAGTAGTDITITFDGETSDGELKWMEDEDYFEFSDDILIASTEKIQFGDTASFIQQSSDGVLRIDGEATVDINASTAVTISNDLKLDSDSAVLGFGADNDVTLTHVADTALLLNSSRQLQFGDSGTYIHQSADGVLDLVADTEIEINATTIDINGNVDISGTLTIGSADISETELEILDGATVTTTELNILDGDTTASSTTVADADRVVFNDAGTMKQVAVTDLAAYFDDEITAMPNLTSVGTLTTLTVDNVIINGSTIGHTGDTDLMTVASGVLTVAGEVDATSLDISGDADIDGTLEADAITVNGTALNTVIAGVTVTDATNSAHVLVTDNESTNEENLITFVEDATSSTGNVGLEMDGNLTYNPSTGTVTATVFKGNIDAVDGDFDGTLEADAITLDGTAITATATLDTGISNNNVPKFTSGVADNDFLRVDGTAIEGRSASEVLSDISAAPAAGDSNIVTTGALNSGSITSGFGAINNGSSAITTTGTMTFGSLSDGSITVTAFVDEDDMSSDSATLIPTQQSVKAFVENNAGAPAAGSSNIVTTGALNSGSITSGFGSIDNGSSAITTTGVITGGTVEATADTSAGDNAAIGFTSAEGLILTGQGSTSDITFKNDADTTVFSIPTGTDDVLFPDDAKILMGAGSDLQIFHDGDNSFIDDAGTGVLSIRSNSISLGKYTGENLASFVADGAVTLFHDNSAKIATASTGVNITDDSAQISLTRPTNSRAGLVKVTNANGGIEYHSDVNGSGETSIVAHTFTGDAPSSDTTYMTILGSGNVGIATASPAYSLDVTGSTNVAAFRSSASNSLVHLPNSGSSGGDNSVSIASVNNDFYVRAGDAERMRIASDGDVYIGKTSEAMATAGSQFRSSGQALDITRDGGSPFNVNRLSNDGELIGFFKDTSQVGSIGIQSSGFYIDGESGHEGIRFANGAITPRENGSDSDGASDLGASNNRFKDGYFSNIVYSTYLRGQNDTDTGIDIGNTGSTADIITFMTGGSEKARIASSSTGKFFVGCTETPSSSVAGSMVSTTDAGSFTSFAAGTGAATHGVFGNGNGVVGSIQTSGSSTSYNTSSDRRLKSNIQDAESASDKIDAIQVRQFDWKADDIHQDYGLIAQELQPIEPMAVTGNADSDEMMGVDYSKLVPMLIKEIQSLRSRVAALEASQ